MMKQTIAAIFLFAFLAQIDAFRMRARDDVVPKMTDDLKIYKALSLYSEVSTGDLSRVFDDLGLKLPSSEFTRGLVILLDPEDTGFFTVKAFLAKMDKTIKTILKFDSYDENHDGFLDEPELNKFNDAEKTDFSVPEMLEDYDYDGDDKLSIKEFTEFLLELLVYNSML